MFERAGKIPASISLETLLVLRMRLDHIPVDFLANKIPIPVTVHISVLICGRLLNRHWQ